MNIRKINFESGIVLSLTGLIFIAFFIYGMVLVYEKNSGDVLLKKKAESVGETIVSNVSGLLVSNPLSIPEALKSFYSDRDIARIKVTNNLGDTVIDYSGDMSFSRSVQIERSIKASNDREYGRLILVVSDNSRWERAELLFDQIYKANLASFWDYDRYAMTRSIESFFRDPFVERIVVKDLNGKEYIARDKKSGEQGLFFLKRDFEYRGVKIGSLEAAFVNLSSVRLNSFINFAVAGALVSGLFLIIIFVMKMTRKEDGVPDPRKLSWGVSESTEEKLKQAIDYINENFRRNISREGLATMVGLNKDNLGRYFQIYTGEKMNEYINRLRIEEASRLILDTDNKIVDIAFAVGFENISTFNRIFTSMMKVKPTDLRKNCKKMESGA